MLLHPFWSLKSPIFFCSWRKDSHNIVMSVNNEQFFLLMMTKSFHIVHSHILWNQKRKISCQISLCIIHPVYTRVNLWEINRGHLSETFSRHFCGTLGMSTNFCSPSLSFSSYLMLSVFTPNTGDECWATFMCVCLVPQAKQSLKQLSLIGVFLVTLYFDGPF